MLSHVSLGVANLEKTAAFYDPVLGSLGYVRLWTGEKGLGYGSPGGGEKLNLFVTAGSALLGAGFHLAFSAKSREAVDEFHRVALSTGGQDLGPPGPRMHYSPTYYAAFVSDPDGHKLEAVHQ